MSSHYDPIPLESDHEDNDEAEHSPMVEDDARTERTRSTDRSNFFREHATDSESDPEEDPPSTDNRAPLLASNTEPRPFGQPARARTATSSSQEETSSQFVTPPPNPNARTTSGLQIWERTLRTLKRWRDSYQNAPAPQMESSSAIRQEFLLDTTPIVVDKLARHEERLDMIEDVVMDMPGAETLAEFQYQIDNTDSNVSYVNDQVQALRRKMDEMTTQFRGLNRSVDQMENKMWDCHTMTAMAIGTTRDNLRTFFGDHAGNGPN